MVTTTYSQQSGIVIPITTESMQIAGRFAQQCSIPEKAEQIRQNTLAVCAVNTYLQLLAIPTDLADSDSWNPIMQLVANVADIKLPDIGTFSCRLINSSSETCQIPPEDWYGHAGYIAVRLDEGTRRATLAGFSVDVPQMEYVPTDRFGPIETLIDQVHQLQTSQSSAVSSQLSTAPSVLNQIGKWVDGIIAEGWQTAAALMNPTELDLAFRTSADLVSPTLDTPTTVTDISRAKLVDLGTHLSQSVRVALVVHITQTADRRTSFILQVRPLGESLYLPEGIELTVLDGNDADYLKATSRAIDNYIQLRFSGQAGEQFGVRIKLGQRTLREQFII
ncbi:hypothetical protein S7335_2781 [Synechococcus sp. PCC 7335]|uniref:DUF1822 family protein n=1 Tax=Synechococcus sp. (strain ATCC 29403 / PCC 7335) TaxID=91464 RepID=UPI00017EB116|nr:DUF1822 family protein [Synechococcus sp. PCC 7335]EDX85082.1 hypothetical protein S7335_2781 [Synechococcus sp. PCC 7335]